MLAADNVDCTEVIVKPGISSPFTCTHLLAGSSNTVVDVIVDNEAKTRTCIHHALSEEMTVNEVSSQWLDGVEAAYFDCRLTMKRTLCS